MFNNTKYKINEEVHNSIIILLSELRSSSKECDEVLCVDSTITTPDKTEIFTTYIKYHKSLPLYKRILGIPTLIKVIINFIKSI